MRNIKNRFSEVNPSAEINNEKSLTQAHFAEDANINTIVQRALKTGTLGDVTNARQPIFGDFTANDYMEMRNSIADVTQQFEALPARLRSRFANDPLQLMRFVNDPRNLAESVKLGFVKMPEGYHINEKGNVAKIGAVQTKMEPTEAPKSDPEANAHNGPKKEGEPS